MRQLAAEGVPAVVSRLVSRRHYLLAQRVCQALGLPSEQVGAVGRFKVEESGSAAMQPVVLGLRAAPRARTCRHQPQ
jgi:hypothetical protein